MRCLGLMCLALGIVALAGNVSPVFAEKDGNKLEWSSGYPKCPSIQTVKTYPGTARIKYSLTLGNNWTPSGTITFTIRVYDDADGEFFNDDAGAEKGAPFSAEKDYTVTISGRSAKVLNSAVILNKTGMPGDTDSCTAPASALFVIRSYTN